VPIKKLEDFKGLRMRAPETPEFIALYKSYGAIPVPMAWAEVYSALQQGVVDGVGADWAGLLTSKLHEVTKYAIELSHVRIIGTLIVSEKWFKTLPDDVKMAIEQAGYESQQVARDHDTRHQAAGKKECIRVGMKVYTPPDVTPFRNAAKSIYPKFYKTVGKETIEWVQNVGQEVSY
jgi:TRAP-type C4-dicarboxylate transport system substrate-binding protein